ncbi:accessory gene regulator ArgB-like protein [Paraclostridium bifermentans]|uniref:accessory gene regulator ArgB-like protein n=1 Tax=Paraclostridium bifermentans TaxID=1490 RepID=UPI00359C7874
MSIIENISYNISNKIGNKANKTQDEIEIINYGLFMTLHTLTGIIITIIIGILIGKLAEMLTITLVASSTKRYSGGVHATSPSRCIIIGIITTIMVVYVSILLGNYTDINFLIIFTLIVISTCNYIFYNKAPVGSKNKPLKKESTRKKLRKKLFVVLSFYQIVLALAILLLFFDKLDSNFIKYIYCIELGILLQCTAITKLGESIILKLDSILTYN